MNQTIISLFSALFLLVTPTLFSQDANIVKLDDVNIKQQTTISVNITVKRSVIHVGPYARFAQKYLGVIVPLSDKDIYSIEDVNMYSIQNGPVPTSFNYPMVNSYGADTTIVMDGIFSKLPDNIVNPVLSLEQQAKNAADKIFVLRKDRFDILRGYTGEYNAGLGAALEEIARLDSEILALFVGKQTVSYAFKNYQVVPGEKNTYVVARFSVDAGLVSDSDLSGQPLVLSIETEKSNLIQKMSPEQVKSLGKDASVMNQYQYTTNSVCQLFMGTDVLAKVTIPIFQRGEIISAPYNLETLSGK